MPLGDSITAGYHVGKGGYRNILRDALIHRGMRVDFIGRSTDKSDGIPDPEHEGYSGHTIGQIAAKADVALQELNPDIILLFAGTNDIRVNGDNDNPNDPLYWRTAPARFEELLAVVWQRRPDAVVLVGTLMPLAETFASREPAAQEFNANLVKIVAAAQARGKRIRLVDFRRSVSAEDLSDGAHPNAAGYEKMAALWAEAIAEVAPGGAEKAPAEPPGPR
jgi:lysophospholipase L1-like esterase